MLILAVIVIKKRKRTVLLVQAGKPTLKSLGRMFPVQARNGSCRKKRALHDTGRAQRKAPQGEALLPASRHYGNGHRVEKHPLVAGFLLVVRACLQSADILLSERGLHHEEHHLPRECHLCTGCHLERCPLYTKFHLLGELHHLVDCHQIAGHHHFEGHFHEKNPQCEKSHLYGIYRLVGRLHH